MEIIGKIEVKGFLRACDLSDGDVFAFLDDDIPYMLCSNNCDMLIINLSTGELEADVCEFPYRPVRRLKAKLIMED